MAQCDPPIEAVFLDAPHVIKIATDRIDDSYDASLDDPDHASRAWWFARENGDGTKTYLHFDETMRYLADFLRREGPFDGVFGFSQGAAVAAVLGVFLRRPALHPAFADAELPVLRFAVLVAAFPVADPALFYVWAAGPAETPSLHVLGRTDVLVCADWSNTLISFFDPACVHVAHHDGGHFIPRTPAWHRRFVDYMASFAPREG